MDGTLTCAIHDFDAIRAELGLPVATPILEAISQLEPVQARAATQHLFDLEMDIANQATEQPGASALLTRLRQTDRKLGILTRNGKEIAIRTLQACGLAEFFPDELVISRDCCAPKPEPAGVHKLVRQWQTQVKATVMVGDYLFDLQAGHAAGASTIHLDVNGTFEWPELTSLGVTSLSALTDALEDSPPA